jgi:hypothetical protein
MFDLFISYSSHDKPWAERLCNDLHVSFPTIRVFYDRESIQLGANWAQVLKDNAKAAKHLVLLWSEKAKQNPTQLAAEVEGFDQSRQAGDGRILIYLPLDRNDYANLGQNQGLPYVRESKIYDPAAADRGIAKLGLAPHRYEWRRMVRRIGDAAQKGEATNMELALLVMNQKYLNLLDPFLDIQQGPGPTLREFLAAAAVSLAEVKNRYGANAFAWTPFGPGPTIIDLMEELRVMVNRSLAAEHHFRWVPCDLVEDLLNIRNEVDLRGRLETLAAKPSAVVVDAVSLFNPIVSKLFARLGKYAEQEHAIIVSLAPKEAPTADRLHESLRANGAPVLDGYFMPQIPSAGSFAHCCMNVVHVFEIERLIRGSLGVYQLRRRKTENSAIFTPGQTR